MIRYFIGATLLIGAVYGATEVWPLLAGPVLVVTSPIDHATIPGGILDVQGHVARVAALSLNGLPIVYDQNGSFSSTLTFPRGGSILRVEARDRFGRTISITRSIFIP